MEEPIAPEVGTKQNNGSGIVFASMGALYVLLCLCLGAFVFVSRQQLPVIQDYFPTETALPTATLPPTATPIVRKPAAGDQVFKSDFSDNTQGWNSKWSNDKVEIKDGKLTLQSAKVGSIAMTKCTACSFAHSNFYMDADFSTNQVIDEPYGIAFNVTSKSKYDGYYVFEINAVKGLYMLYKMKNVSSENIWMLRISKKSSLIKPYPEINKLGAFLDKDMIELYINGMLVDSYQNPGSEFTSGEFGFYVDNGGFQLIVDNFFSYDK